MIKTFDFISQVKYLNSQDRWLFCYTLEQPSLSYFQVYNNPVCTSLNLCLTTMNIIKGNNKRMWKLVVTDMDHNEIGSAKLKVKGKGFHTISAHNMYISNDGIARIFLLNCRLRRKSSIQTSPAEERGANPTKLMKNWSVGSSVI